MVTKLHLESGIHFYKSGQYDKAINYFLSLKETESSNQEIANINMYLGKCYFNKKEQCLESVHIIYQKMTREAWGRTPSFSYFRDSTSYTPMFKKMINRSLVYFEAALQNNPSLGRAHYWKGKVLEYQGAKNKAYVCYTQAASLSNKKKYRKNSQRLFSENPNLMFRETTPLSSMTFKQALESCSSKNTYVRMEACHYLLTLNNLSLESISQVKDAISPIAGYKLLCYYIPCTGDPDQRVRQTAQGILLNLQIGN